MSKLNHCSIDELRQALDGQEDCQVIDVREYSEYHAERLEGSTLVPLSALEQNAGLIDILRSQVTQGQKM